MRVPARRNGAAAGRAAPVPEERGGQAEAVDKVGKNLYILTGLVHRQLDTGRDKTKIVMWLAFGRQLTYFMAESTDG